MAEPNPNQELLDDFLKWKEKTFNRYVRSVDRTEDKFLDAAALGRLDEALRATAKNFDNDHEKFVEKTLKLQTTLESAVEQPKFNSKNRSEFDEIKEEQAQLQDRLTPLRMAVAKVGELSPAEKPNEALQKEFNSWKLEFNKFPGKLSGVTERAQDVIFELGADTAGLYDRITVLKENLADLSTRVKDLETAIQSSLQEPALNFANSTEFGSIKSQLDALNSDLAEIEKKISKAAEGEKPNGEEPDISKNADSIIRTWALWAAGAGLIPLPVLDVVGIAGVQAKMLDELYKNYYPVDPTSRSTPGFSQAFSRNLLTVVLGSFGAETLFAGAFASALKFVPVIGALPAAGAVSLIGGAATYIVGNLVKEELEKGLTPTQIVETLKTVPRSKLVALRKQYRERVPSSGQRLRTT